MAIGLTEIAKTVTAIGVVGGGALTLDRLHEPRGAADHVRAEVTAEITGIQSDLRIDRILDLVNESRADGGPDYLCDAIDKEIVALCSERPDHYLCSPDTRRELKNKAGCK